MSDSLSVYYNEVPPSSNQNTGVGGRGKPEAIAATKRKWEGIFAMLLIQAKLPRLLDVVTVTPEVQFTTKARRDMDNFYFPIAKPLGDALRKGGWIADDTPQHYKCERVRLDPERLVPRNPMVKGQLRLTVEYQ